MSDSPPAAKQLKLSCPVNALTDADLEEIFKRLPPFERLIVSEVCRRWHEISRKSWLDVNVVDLSPIPDNHIGAVIRQCANLQSVIAVNKSFRLNSLAGLSTIDSLSRAKFYGCEFALDEFTSDAFSGIFSDNVEKATWTELIVHDATFSVHNDDPDNEDLESFSLLDFVAASLPWSLTRLQLSGFRYNGKLGLRSSLNGLEQLENLECLILHSTPDPSGVYCAYDPYELVGAAVSETEVFDQICRLKNLKELCVGPVASIFEEVELGKLMAKLAKLEVLFLNFVSGNDIADDLKTLITTASVLRILVLSGEFVPNGYLEPIELSARERFPNGFGADPLPLLHIFVGKRASENLIFEKSSDAAIIHPINAPMPEFLRREDIAPIFEGVWVVEKIKEAAENGGRLE